MSQLAGRDFVLWNGHSFGPGRAQFKSLKAAKAFINAPVVKEYTDLVDALTRMYGRIGMHEICARCFRGEKRGPDDIHEYPSHNNPGYGCCKPCGLQGHQGCLSKPLGCAVWMCGYTRKRFGSTLDFVDGVGYHLIHRALETGSYGFFNDPRPKTLDFHSRRLLRVARWAIESWATT